jgi:sulfoxide reductase heme-binding subunit YedZ
MLTKRDQNAGENRQWLMLAGAGGGILTLLMLIGLVWFGIFAPSGHVGQSAGEALSQPLRAVLVEQAQLMGLPLEAGSQAFWFLARAGGIVAYLLLWLATCWGIMMSSKLTQGYVTVPAAFALHEYLPILSMVFVALHVLALLGDTYISFSIWQLLVPFTSSYEPFWTGLGSLSFYLSLALIASFYLRKQISQKVWRAFHYTSYLAYLIALTHGVMAGSDSGTPGMRVIYLVTGGLSLFLVYYRLLSYLPRKNHTRPGRLPAHEPARPRIDQDS